MEDAGDNDKGLLSAADEEQPGLLSEQMGIRTPTEIGACKGEEIDAKD